LTEVPGIQTLEITAKYPVAEGTVLLLIIVFFKKL
jgi:hypothetical protein